MGILDFVKGGVKEMMIARPDAVKHLVVYKHPDTTIPFYSQLTVDSDEAAVFFKDGKVVGVLPPGRHTLQTQNIPFLGQIVDKFTGGNVFISEVFFVKTQPVRDIPFGGPIGMMIDPLTQEMCTPRMFGKFSLVVMDPVRFVIGYVGQAAAGDNDSTFEWIKGLFFMGVKTVIGEMCEAEGKSVIQCVALTQMLAQRFVERAPNLEDIGVRVLQMGNFNINFDEEERARLVQAQGEVAKAQRGIRIAEAEAKARQHKLDQDFGQDARYVQQLAGNWQNYAGGRAMMGAGEGMAKGGDAGVAAVGAQMAAGIGMAGMMAGQMAHPQGPQFPQPNMAAPVGPYGQPAPQPPAAAAAAAAGSLTCAKCNAVVAPGKFCAECGAPLGLPPKKYCTGCGSELGASAKFCANCGNPA